jgi:DNA-binding transcriptional LysR family regulator
MASDYIAAVLVGPAIQALAETAPSIQIDMRQPNDQVIKLFERGQIDLLLTPEEFVTPNHPTELLFEERHIVVGWSENPLVDRPLTPQEFADSPQVAVALGPSMSLDYAGRYLGSLMEDRRIEIYAPSFSVVPWFVIGTHRLAVMHERFAQLVARYLPLKIQPLPIEIPPMREMLQYHSARTHDSGIIWLRRMLHEMADKMA